MAGGPPHAVLSPAILEEYQRAGTALAARYPEIGAALEPVLTFLAQSATIVDASDLPNAISADPADDKFLACALATGARVIVRIVTRLIRIGVHRERQ